MPYIEALQNYAVFSGRATRTQFWLFTLINFLISVAIGVITGVLTVVIGDYFGIVPALYGLALLVPSLAIGARRLHDTRRSGWWQLIGLVPVIGLIVLIIFWVMGSDEDNQYGPRPS